MSSQSSIVYSLDSNGKYRSLTSNASGHLFSHDSASKLVLDSIKGQLDGDIKVDVQNASVPVTFALASSGAQANAWSAASVADDGNSSAVDISDAELVSVIGDTSNTTDIHNIVVQLSQDNTNYYNAYYLSPDASGNFHHDFKTAFKHVRLQAQKAGTITATIAKKK
jgi:hypothetical protein